MSTRIIPTIEDQYLEMHFPKAGVDRSVALHAQPARQITKGLWARTCPVGVNVRAFDAAQIRSRGGSRPGLSRHISTPLVAGWIVQHLDMIVRTSAVPVQISQSGRVVTLVAVSQGDVYYAVAGATSWTLATNNTGLTPPLVFTGILQSSPLNQLLYFADGTNWAYYKPSTNTVETWSASAGSLPEDSDTNTPRLITTWRARIVLGGLLLDPQNIFFSAVGDATDFDYAPVSSTPTQAVALNLGATGIVGDVVVGLIPFSDDILVILCDHSIHMLRGDPMAGGQIDLISNSVGGVWGQAWCQDPFGTIYFYSNRNAVFSLVPGQQPQRISQAIEPLLKSVNTGENTIRLAWNDRMQGLHVFISPTEAPAETTHYFFEQRTGAWWQDRFENTNHDPLACCAFDGNESDDRVLLVGSWDGYVRAVDPEATTDDGYDIESEVVIGPILAGTQDAIRLKSLQAELGEGSGDVAFEVLSGETAELALSSEGVAPGTWAAGRNNTSLTRRTAHALYVKITSSNPWALERIRAVFAGTGKVQMRRKQ